MDQATYDNKLAQLLEVFQGDREYAQAVLDKWLQKHRAEFEARLLAEVSRRLEGLNSIVPITLKVVIDANGVQVPGGAPQAVAKPAPKGRRAEKKSSLVES